MRGKGERKSDKKSDKNKNEGGTNRGPVHATFLIKVQLGEERIRYVVYEHTWKHLEW
jgi:hypothetical protein